MKNKTISKIITKVGLVGGGAPMGRPNVGTKPIVKRVYDSQVPMTKDGAYDSGGAYWGSGPQLRVQYTQDLSYIHFYRKT